MKTPLTKSSKSRIKTGNVNGWITSTQCNLANVYGFVQAGVKCRIKMQVNVMLDPGLAFGTGTHPTTALCLEWLDGLDLTGKTVIDFGCGSGILAIAALKLGAKMQSVLISIHKRFSPAVIMQNKMVWRIVYNFSYPMINQLI